MHLKKKTKSQKISQTRTLNYWLWSCPHRYRFVLEPVWPWKHFGGREIWKCFWKMVLYYSLYGCNLISFYFLLYPHAEAPEYDVLGFKTSLNALYPSVTLSSSLTSSSANTYCMNRCVCHFLFKNFCPCWCSPPIHILLALFLRCLT